MDTESYVDLKSKGYNVQHKRLKKELAILDWIIKKKTGNINKYHTKFESGKKIADYLKSFEIIDGDVVFRMVFENKYNLEINMKFPKDYPFKPPKITINGVNYIKFLGNASHTGKCLCCISLTCVDKWSAWSDMIDMLFEIHTNLSNLYKPINDIFYESILNKYLGYQI